MIAVTNPIGLSDAVNEVCDPVPGRERLLVADTSSTKRDDFVDRIQQCHERFVRTSSKLIGHAKQAGDWLRKAKKRCGHGRFTSWFKTHFEFSVETARVYMRISKEWATLAPIVSDDPKLSVEGLRNILRPPKKQQPHSSDSSRAELVRADLSGSFKSRLRELSDDQLFALYERREEIFSLMFKTVGPTVLASEELE